MRRLLRREVDRVVAPYLGDLKEHLRSQDDRTGVQESQIAELAEVAGTLQEKLAEVGAGLEGFAARAEAELQRGNAMQRHIYEEDAAHRRRLDALRRSEEYELAYTEPEPLVSFVIPTYDRYESLRNTSLPSLLGQTYGNIEVIVAGDGSPPETERVIAEFGDSRVRFHNRSIRGPYPDDRSVRWYVIGTPPYNDAIALARGRWIGALGDDDAARPEHVEVLLEAARENRCEHCYGRHLVHYRGGEKLEVGGFPPEKGNFVLQTALYHAGLSFFKMQPADYLNWEPNDWSLCRRMLQAGVRFGMVDRILADKYESRFEKHADWRGGVPSVD